MFKLVAKGGYHKDNNGNNVFYAPIYTTTAYNMLEYWDANRKTTGAHVAEMGISVSKNGVLRCVVVAKYKGKYYIVDGQHIYRYLKNAGLPIIFMLKEPKSDEEMMQIITDMNTTSKGWGLIQYLNSWSHFYKDYQIILEMRREFAMVPTHVAMLLGQCDANTAKKKIKNGTFKAINIQKAKKSARTIESFYQKLESTGLIRYSYTTLGFITFLNSIGWNNYYKIEKEFLNYAYEYNQIHQYKALARVEDVMEFLMIIYQNFTQKD